jgi:LCP family protein required for cell wall assembly
MSPAGDDRPPRRSGGSEGRGGSEKPGQPGDQGKPGSGRKPDYKVFGRGGGSGQKRQRRPRREPTEKGEKPPYRVYRSRPSLLDRIRKPSLESLRREDGGIRGRLGRIVGGKRPWLRWIVIFAVGWLLLSFITFAISAQIQKGKLPESAREALEGGPDVLVGQNILILGGDRRGKTQRNAAGTEGQGPPRADTIMVLHASLTSFRKLSIPRDTYAAIPNCGEQKINASLACNTRSTNGNPAETIRTVENFLGIDINHIVIVDFDGFADFIDTLGGVTIDVPDTNGPNDDSAVVCGDVDGGKEQGGVSLKLPAGETTLEGQKALAFARLRINECDPGEDDRDRAERQQLVLNAIKGRLTSITRFPYNFIKGPFIGWDAPKAFISDMGGFTLPQVAIAAILGGSGETNVLGGNKGAIASGPGGSLFIPQGECEEAVKKLTGGDPPREPECSPG